MTETLARPASTRKTRRAVIDCDIHNSLAPGDALQPYLSAEWREYEREIGGHLPSGRLYPKGAAAAFPDGVLGEAAEAITGGNARSLYRLETPVAVR